MAAWRRAIELSLTDMDTAKLRSIAQSRTESASRFERRGYCWPTGRPLVFCRGPSARPAPPDRSALCRAGGGLWPAGGLEMPAAGPGGDHHDRGQGRVGLCGLRKAKDLGYPHELWTTRLLAWHAREHGPAEGHASCEPGSGTVCNILDQEDVKPHKVRYFLERRDPDFAEKLAEVLCVYREVKLLKRRRPREDKPSVWWDRLLRREAGHSASPRPPRTCRPGPADMRPSDASMNTSATTRSGCWPKSISHRPGSRSRQGPPPQPRIDRIPQAPRRRLSSPDRDQADPRQSFRTHLQRDQSLARRQPPESFAFVFSPRHGSWLNLIEGFFANSPAPCCATSASPQNRNSRTASWPPWTTSTNAPSFTRGPISSTRPPDMI